ncbi:glucuronate isomerase [Spiroplasma endosymbiont of Aspidapion aeneum]|uniref:glucuronate isomerase n=1 Tax=Spiroplasma endosymbiont of Aspidapion aeneum TaxID=3066276 RepID=UPI00313BBA79
MKQFCGEDFLLESELAEKLYAKTKDMQILDYHCHLKPQEMLSNYKFRNLTDLWLTGDHYKWRQMRTCGVSEKYITGNADDYDKYIKFVESCEMMLGNPVSQWSQLELTKYFNIKKPLILKNAKEIWEQVNKQLDKMTCRSFLEMSNVYAVCTTDDPIDLLEEHTKLKDDWNKVKVIPNFRPDKIMKINAEGFNDYIKKLSKISDVNINNYESLIEALYNRIDYFHTKGSRGADHAVDVVLYEPATRNELNEIITKRIKGKMLNDGEFAKFIGNILLDLARKYHDLNWVMMVHLNCKRDANKPMFSKLGPDTGFDCSGEQFVEKQLNDVLGTLKSEDKLPKMSLFSLNATNWMSIATIAGCYQENENGIKGKIQLGTAWWFADTLTNNTKQINDFAELQSLGVSLGMLTDSRSFSSFTRHDYYRRLLCNIIATWANRGLCVNDEEILVRNIKNIFFNNAKEFFGY